MQLIPHRRDGELVGWIEGRLRGSKRPGADAGVLLGEDGSGGEAEEDQRANCGIEMDGINVADSKSLESGYMCHTGNT
jgi:hypothetical protein